jgi:hypothetical protein
MLAGMDAFEALRHQAAQKRDAIIKAARAEFWRTAQAITVLRYRLDRNTPKRSGPKPKALMALLCETIPRDRLFTIAEVIELLAEADPERHIHVRTIRPYFQRMEKKGLVRPIRRGPNGIVWAAADCPVTPDPHGTRTLPEVAADTLREFGPLTAVELVLALQARGYRTDANPRTLYAAIKTSLRRNKQFRQDGGKWTQVRE